MSEQDGQSGRMPAFTTVSANRDRVVGLLTALEVDSNGSPLAILTSFAVQLARTGAIHALDSAQTVQETDCHARVFERDLAGVLKGEAVPLHRSEITSNWRVTIEDEKGRTVSEVSVTCDIVSSQPLAVLNPIGNTADEAIGQRRVDAKAGNDFEPVQTAADKRREQIAAAASEVIARKGFAKATMREIADAACMHVPTMYQYVASKDEMLELVYYWTMARVRTDVAEATIDCHTATEKLRATIASLIDKGDRFRHSVGVLNREFKSLSREARVRVLEDYRKLLFQIAELVTGGIQSGEFRPVEPEIAANFIETACDIWSLRQFAVGKFGRQSFKNEITELILRSLSRP